MNTRSLLAASLIMLSNGIVDAITIQEATLTNQWSQPVSKMLPTVGGTVEAQMQYYRHDSHFRDGSLSIGLQESVFIPENGLIWIGNPCEHYLVFGDAIIGIYPQMMGAIVIDRQSKKIHGTPSDPKEKIKEIQRTAAGKLIESGVGGGINKSKIRLHLSEFTDTVFDPFQDMRSARGSDKPTVTGINITDKEAAIELVGTNGVKVSLVFDREMKVIRMSVDGKVVYPKTK